MQIDPISTPDAPLPLAGAPYSQALRFGDLVFVSGQIGLDPETGSLVQGGVREQTERVLQNLGEILAQAGSGLDRVLRAGVYLVNLSDWPAMNDVYKQHVGEPFPARSAVQVAGLPGDALVEIDAIAAVG